MTSILLTVHGAMASASVTGPLTSGMVGIPVTIEYDDAWDGLTKNMVCRCSQWGKNSGETRTILNVEKDSTVAHEVMQPGMHLYLGIEGFSENGGLVMPTIWARCGGIQYGANTDADPSADPQLPIWNQLQSEIEQINRDGITQERMDEILACADSASQAAESAKKSEQNAVAASHNAVSNANTAESFANQAQTHAENARLSASSAANLANGALQAQRAAEAAAERAEAASALSQGPIQGGMTADAKAALMAVVESIAVFTVDNPRELIDNLRNALYSDPVASIRAVYTQSRTVYASDSLDVLRDDLVVTAVHTDGSSTVRTDYTLSGTLAAGTSVITAALDGKTAMFEVTVAAARIPATPIASGSCSITATAGEVSASCAVTVAMPLTGYNFGNPYLNYVNADPTTLGKTDEELRGKFYKAQYNDCAKAHNGGASANFTAILLYPMSSGTYYVRTVNRSRVPSNKFMISALCCLQATGCWHKGFSQWKRLHRL